MMMNMTLFTPGKHVVLLLQKVARHQCKHSTRVKSYGQLCCHQLRPPPPLSPCVINRLIVSKPITRWCLCQPIKLCGCARIRQYMTKVSESLDLDNVDLLKYLNHVTETYNGTLQQILSPGGRDDVEMQELNRTLTLLEPVASRMQKFNEKCAEMEEITNMISDIKEDKDLFKMAETEREQMRAEVEQIQTEILTLLVPPARADNSDVILEVKAGVGGQEAMLFTGDMFKMYSGYAASKGWNFEVMDYDTTEQGGLRKATASLTGSEIYRHLKYEAGVHRVQRVPQTEKSGRIHTSTMTVAILPLPSEIDIQVHPKDLRIDTFKSSGKGGQHVNTTDSAVRIVHLPTGMSAECQTDRSQIKNRAGALKMLRSRLFEKELRAQEEAQRSRRKGQIGSGARSDKIRTYNFPQDRITDHRLGCSMHNMAAFLDGGALFSEMISKLQNAVWHEELRLILDEFEESGVVAMTTKSRS